MKKGLFPSVAFLVLFILLSGCVGEKAPTTRTSRTTKVQYKLFHKLTSGVKINLNSLAFINSAKGIVVGDSGTILFTKNGGHDWKSVGGVTAANLYGVAMANLLTAIAVGEKGTILRSKDGGLTWNEITSDNVGLVQTLKGVAFSTDRDGYAVGESGVIFSTHDTGTTWKKMHGKTDKTLNSICYNKNKLPCVVGDKGQFVSSVDTGKTWKDTNYTDQNLRSIHFSLEPGLHSHSDLGFAVGDSGTILISSDGGRAWKSVTSPVQKNLRGVFLYSSKFGYAVGESGTVLKYDGTDWKLLSSATTKTINAVDPAYWNPSSTCVGEDGLIMLINPPAANDGSTATISGQDDCKWEVNVSTSNLIGKDPAGNSIYYKKLEVCSSIDQSDLKVIPGSGWVVRDQFYSISADLAPNEVYPSQQNRLDSLTLLMNPNTDVTSGYLSCYLKDDQENFYLLSTYEIQCSP